VAWAYCVVPPGAGVAGEAAGGAGLVSGVDTAGALGGMGGLVVRSRSRSISPVVGGGTSVGRRSQPANSISEAAAAATPSTMRDESKGFMVIS
jgi:cysteine sulfinate desulfinase/cysteine desulfurase-like protein